jgi:hypothetical protein
MKCCLSQDSLGSKTHDGIILRCVNIDEANRLINEIHLGYCGGHFVGRTISHEILRT